MKHHCGDITHDNESIGTGSDTYPPQLCSSGGAGVSVRDSRVGRSRQPNTTVAASLNCVQTTPTLHSCGPLGYSLKHFDLQNTT